MDGISRPTSNAHTLNEIERITLPYLGRKVTPIGEAALTAQKIIQAANDQAATLISSTKKKVLNRTRATLTRARERGIRLGKLAAERETTLRLLELQRCYEEQIVAAEKQCLQIAIAVAENVIADRINTPKLFAQKIKKALADYSSEKITAISIHPRDLEQLDNQLAQHLPIRADDRITPGDIELKTALGTILLNWRAHLETIKESLISRITSTKKDRRCA